MRLTRRQFAKALGAFGLALALPTLPTIEAAPVEAATEEPRRRLWVLNRELIPLDADDWAFYADGKRDATAFLQGQLNAVRDGGRLDFRPGDYRISGPLAISNKRGVIFSGYGAVIRKDADAPYGLILDETVSDCQITDWTILGEHRLAPERRPRSMRADHGLTILGGAIAMRG